MPYQAPVLPASEPHPVLLSKLASVKRTCLVTIGLLAALSLMAHLAPGLGQIVPGNWKLMEPGSALAALLSALSLQLTERYYPRRLRQAGAVMAAAVALLACGVLYKTGLPMPAGSSWPLSMAHPASRLFSTIMSPHSALGFLLLGTSTLLIGARKRLTVHLADVSIICLSLLVLILVSGHIFGVIRLFGPNSTFVTSPVTLLCLLLLAVVTVLRRTDAGVFSIFMGSGIGSRVARILSPFLLVLPFVREGARARMIGEDRIAPNYITAILATLSAALALVLLLYLARQLNRMEVEIRDLSLRDALTGLYNRRGFYLLAEQALRMAHRAYQPFSVLYVDVDNLKQINDSLGHTTGSEFLTETAEILQAALRETDVVGRIGGDEFAVAGQFSEDSIAVVAERLKEAAAQRNAGEVLHPLSFSVGHVTSDDRRYESLDELLSRADEAMYREKRSKKQLRRVR
jgi:diguanylate cyclase (GGDEF)-like protein